MQTTKIIHAVQLSQPMRLSILLGQATALKRMLGGLERCRHDIDVAARLGIDAQRRENPALTQVRSRVRNILERRIDICEFGEIDLRRLEVAWVNAQSLRLAA